MKTKQKTLSGSILGVLLFFSACVEAGELWVGVSIGGYADDIGTTLRIETERESNFQFGVKVSLVSYTGLRSKAWPSYWMYSAYSSYYLNKEANSGSYASGGMHYVSPDSSMRADSHIGSYMAIGFYQKWGSVSGVEGKTYFEFGSIGKGGGIGEDKEFAHGTYNEAGLKVLF